MAKINWNNLTKEERSEYMMYQMSPSYCSNDGYLPDDCSDCGSCGQPILGSGWCNSCYKRFDELRNKLLTNSSTIEGEQSEYLSPNKENENNG